MVEKEITPVVKWKCEFCAHENSSTDEFSTLRETDKSKLNSVNVCYTDRKQPSSQDESSEQELKPKALVICMDTSGSMNYATVGANTSNQSDFLTRRLLY